MKRTAIYCILMLMAYVAALIALATGRLPAGSATLGDYLTCGLIGGVGGSVYCLRSVYISYCVRQNWDDRWFVWYSIRPFVSACSGALACLFLKAGLILLETQRSPEASNLAFYAIAFVAGYNVDNFLGRIEDVAQSLWGISKSRMATNYDKQDTAEINSPAVGSNAVETVQAEKPARPRSSAI